MSVTDGPNLGKMISAATGDNFDADFRTFLRSYDILVQAAVISKTLTAPPGSPANGDRYIVAGSPTGAWSGKANNVAVWTTDNPASPSGVWEFYAPKAGWLFYSAADSAFYGWGGSAWVSSGYAIVQQAGTSKPAEGKLNFLAPITATDNSGAGSTDVAVPVVVGDSGSGGVKGLVPAPSAGDAAAGKFLKADGTYQIPPGTGGATYYQTVEQAATVRTQRGALNFLAPITATDNSGNTSTDIAVPNLVGDSGSGGVKGLVPAPGAGDAAAGKFLKADGTFAVPAGGSSGPSCKTRKKYGIVSVSNVNPWIVSFIDFFTKFNSTSWNSFTTPDANGGARSEEKSTSGAVDAAWGMSCNDQVYATGKHVELWAAIRFTDTTDCAHWVAMVNGSAGVATFGNSDTNSSVKYAGFRYSTIAGDSHWQAVTGDGSATTATETGITPDGKEHTFAIFFDDDNSQTLFYIDGVLVATNTTHRAASGTNLGYYISSRKHSSGPGNSNLIGYGQIVSSSDV